MGGGESVNKTDLRAGRRKRQPMLDPRKLGERLPPHSVEAEQGVLGCVLLAGNDLLPDFVSKCPDDAFYDLRNRSIAECLKAMWNDRVPIDMITVSQRLKDRGVLEQVGGLGYLMSLPNMVPSAANFEEYSEIMAEKWTLRRLLTCCAAFTSRVYEHEGTVKTLIDEWERDALAVGSGIAGRTGGPADIQALQAKIIEEYELAQTQGRPMGLLTGYPDLDHRCGGMMAKDLIVVAAEQSAGKTTLALNIAVRVAESGVSVAFYSMDSSVESLMHRIHCMKGEVDGSLFRRGNATESDIMAMMRGTKALAAMRERLFLYDCPLSDAGLMAMARSDWQRGARLFIVDYLQCVAAEGINDTEKVGNVSKALKRMAIELDSPVIVISSLNRDFEGKPQLRNLRQSGQIQYDANKVLLLSTDSVSGDMRTVICNVAKNKDGGRGEVELMLFAAQFRFESVVL